MTPKASQVRKKIDLRVPAAAAHFVIWNEFDGVAGPRVFRVFFAVVIGNPRDRIERHVLQDAAEPDRVIDLRFLLRRQAYRLGVTAALDVEYAVVRPAVLVVAD